MPLMLLRLVVGLGLGSSMQAGILYSDFGPGQSFSSFASVIGSLPGQNNQTSAASPFTVATDSTLTAIDFAAFYGGGPNQLTVYLTSGALPGVAIESFDFTNVPSAASVLTATSALQPTLFAGTTYWIVLTVDDLANTWMGWDINSTGALGVAFNHSAGAWTEFPLQNKLAFDVQGTGTPEPATWFLMGVSLLLWRGRSGIGRRV